MKNKYLYFLKAVIILSFVLSLAFLNTSCQDGIFESENGNVTFTLGIREGRAALRPAEINIAAFNKFTVEFTNQTNGAVQVLTINKPQNSGSINLTAGTWNINAFGFILIEDREYEAARCTSFVTVGTSKVNIPLTLQTGILDGSNGIFKFNIDYPSNVTEAELKIAPLSNLHGIPNTNTGKIVDLKAGRTGSYELQPGYYLLNLSAQTEFAGNGSMLAIWTELVHIYSGQITSAQHTFIETDFSGTLALSGLVQGGELEGERITSAVMKAFSDANYLNQIASIDINNFSKLQASPFYHTALWSINVPSSFVGKSIYIHLEEILTSPSGVRAYNRFYTIDNILKEGVSDIILKSSYTWEKSAFEDNDFGDWDFTVNENGSVKITNSELSEYQIVSFKYPAENNIRYVYEFDAWTENGTCTLYTRYINNYKDNYFEYVQYELTKNINSFAVVSAQRYTTNALPQLDLILVFNNETSAFIKPVSIRPSNEYNPPQTEGGNPRFTAEPVTQEHVSAGYAPGIAITLDLTGLPPGVSGLQFYEEKTSNCFEVYGIGSLKEYSFIYPYVAPGEEYIFRLQWEGIKMAHIFTEPVTALTGRGEFGFKNDSDLIFIKKGNNVEFNVPPVLLNFEDVNLPQQRFRYSVATGTSWIDPSATWQFAINKEEPSALDLLGTEIISQTSINLSKFINKTCFVYASYYFNYNNSDIYINKAGNQPRGSFTSNPFLSTPFTYPNLLNEALSAEVYEEGIKLIVDMTKIPVTSSSMQFHTADWTSASFWMSDSAWKNDYGIYYGMNKIEILYPFVKPGKKYTFKVDFGGTGIESETVITSVNGIGELASSNWSNVGLIYNNKTSTLSVSEKPDEPVIADSSLLGRKHWQLVFNKGINWSDSAWMGTHDSNSQFSSVIFDHTFIPSSYPALGKALSGQATNVVQLYVVYYNGFKYEAQVGANSPSFQFPEFNYNAGAEVVWIETAFDADKKIILYYSGSSDYFNAYVNNPYYQKSIDCQWFVNGTFLEDYKTNNYISFSYYELENRYEGILNDGINYGLVIVTLDGVQFAKEFSFVVTK